MKSEILAWGPAIFWVLVLFFLSELRAVPSALELFLVVPDKIVHFGLYAMLGAALAWARSGSSLRPPHFVLLGLGSLYGALDEWHQSFVPGRMPAIGDWLADVAGLTAGYALITYLPGPRRSGITE